MADQAFASASNFVVGVVVARVAGPRGLGAFALAYACWVAINNVHRSLVTDPMAIHGDGLGADAALHIEHGFAAEISLGVSFSLLLAAVGAVVLACGERPYGVAILAVAPWITFLDLQDYWRWIGFMRGTPGKSLSNDGVFNCVQAVGLVVVIVAGLHSVTFIIAAWGLGALAGTLFGLRQYRVRPVFGGGVRTLRARWHMSKWLAGYTLTSLGATQLNLVAAAAILGPVGFGGMKAAQALVAGPTSVVINGTGSFGLPEASRALEDRGWRGMRRVTFLVSAAGFVCAALWGAVIVGAGDDLLRALYGSQFGGYGAAASLFALSLTIVTLTLGSSIALKAARRTRFLFSAEVMAQCTSVGAVIALALTFGVTGAAAASVLTSVVFLGALAVCRQRAKREYVVVDETRAGVTDGVLLPHFETG